MKKILCLLLFIFLVLPVQAVTLEGSVTYTVEQAREEAFKDVEWEIPKQLLRKHRKDPNYTMNMYAKKYSQNVLTDRYINFFADGAYGYYYFDSPEYGFYYGEKGKLIHIEKRTVDIYPTKFYKYNLKGNLMAVVLVVSETESFIYFKDGRLTAHWIKDKAYDKDGNVIEERINDK